MSQDANRLGNAGDSGEYSIRGAASKVTYC